MDFKSQIIYTLYGDDHETYFNDIREVVNRMDQFDVDELMKTLNNSRYVSEEVVQMLDDPFVYEIFEGDPITDYVVNFVKDLRIFESKYLWELLKGNINGPVDFYETIEDPNQPAEYAQFYRVRICFPFFIHNVEENRSHIPDDIIEKDILYVACQCTNISPKDADGNCPNDRLEQIILEIARKYQHSVITERDAIHCITGIIDSIHCIPSDFYDKYFYHKHNPYFYDIHVELPEYNMLIRSNMLKDKHKAKWYVLLS